MKIKSLLFAGAAVLGLTAGGTALSQNMNVHAQNINFRPNTVRPTRTVRRPAIRHYQNSNLVGRNDLIRHHHLRLPRAKAAVAMDGRTGQVVYQKNANQRRFVASTGKLMTLYLTERKLARHPHAWNQRVGVSNAIVRMGSNSNFDSYHFARGHRYRIGDIFKGALVGSDCDAATRLGQWVGGSNRRFINIMNQQARSWHLNANFTSASGLENHDLAPYGFWCRGGYYNGTKISARSLAVITYHLLRDFPSIMKYSRIHNITLAHRNNHNYNNILPGRKFYQRGLHTDGLKTGYTGAAGYCFVGTGKKPGKDRLITVILHDPTEFSDTDDLMHFVYRYSRLYR